MILLLLFIIFKARRKQRIIPVVTPPENESLRFIEMVGKLYFQRGDNKDLAQKKSLYFQEYIRSHFSVSMTNIGIEELSVKINGDVNDLRKLIDLIKTIEISKDVNDKDLILLNNLIFKLIPSN